MHRDGKMTELAPYRVQREAFHISVSISTDSTRSTQKKKTEFQFPKFNLILYSQ